jgi:aspartate racemase
MTQLDYEENVVAEKSCQAIGLIGGLGPGATIHYYERLTREFVARGVTPRLLISHADMKLVLARVGAGALDELADYFTEHVESLARAGADFVAIGSVTPHICAPQLSARISLPFLDLIDCTRSDLSRRGARRIAILGTQFVMRSDMYGRLDGFEVVRLAADALDLVHENYMKIAAAGAVEGSGADVEGMRAVAQGCVRDQGVEAVLLAGTELSLAFQEADCGFPALDCARAHLDAMISRAIGDIATN